MAYTSITERKSTNLDQPIVNPVIPKAEEPKTSLISKLAGVLGIGANKQEPVPTTPEPKVTGGYTRVSERKSVANKNIAPTSTVAPTGGYTPIAKRTNKIAVTPKQKEYFYSADKSGATLGRSDLLDESGVPFLGYRKAGDTSTTTDKTRVAPTFDPRVAQPLTRDQYYNPRAVDLRNRLKDQLGIDYSEELDHRIALTLLGSNATENLKAIPKKDNQAFGKEEGRLAREVASGKKSIFDAQIEMAKIKGIKEPYTGKGSNRTPLIDIAAKKAYQALDKVLLPVSKQLISSGSLGIGGVPQLAKSLEKATTPIIEKASQIPVVNKLLLDVTRKTSGVSAVKAGIKSAFDPNVTFDQAFKAVKEDQQAKNTTFTKKFLTQLGDAAPQSALGVALNFVPYFGNPLSATYWASISAGSQIEEKGKVTSPTNIAIDVIGDRMLGVSLQSLFKKPAKTLVQTVKQSFVTEGGTEVAQDLLKYANDWRLAKNDNEKQAVLDKAKQYFTSGQILLTLGVGGVSGAGIGAGAYAAGKIGSNAQPPIVPTVQQSLPTGTYTPVKDRQTINVPDIGEVPIIGTVDSATGQITMDQKERMAEETRKKAGLAPNLIGDLPYIPKEGVVAPTTKALPSEIKKYSNASDFIKSKKLDPDSIMVIDDKNFIVENTAGNEALLTDIPVSDLGKPKFTTLNQPKYKAGRVIKDPIEVTLENGEYIITDGANRFTQAIANGDKTIPAIIEVNVGGESIKGKSIRSAVEARSPQNSLAEVKTTTSKTQLDPLLQEARKYKTAEEFVKSSDLKVEYAKNKLKVAEDAKPITVTVYHGSPDARFAEEFNPAQKGYFKDAPDLLPDNTQWNELYGSTGGGFKTGTGVYEGISFTDDFRVAKSYADKPAFDSQNSVPMVLERTVTLNKPKVIDVANGEWKISLEKTIEQAKKEGYDGIIFKNIKDNYHPSTTQKPSNNIIAFSPDQIKTKSQLTDIWERANKITPTKTKSIPAKDQFKVGDILDPQGNTNMVGRVKISEITGNTLKFIDSKGTEYAGMQRSLVRDLINGGSWKKVETNKTIKPKTEKVVKDQELPEELQMLQLDVELGREALKNHPLNNKENRFLVDREGRIRELGDTRGNISNKIEDRMAELGITDPTEFARYVEKYFKDQEKLKLLEKKFKMAVADFKAGKPVRGVYGGYGSLASPRGSKTVRKIIERQQNTPVTEPQQVPQDFKISQRAKDILKEFGVVSGERSISSRFLGLYKPLAKKVRVQAYYDITTVTHEAVHAIDDKINFTKRLIEATGRGAEVRKRLTQIYAQLYPGGKVSHKLDKRLKEGLAVLFENYFYNPTEIQAAYPDLVGAFIKPTGQYYDPLFGKLLSRMNELVDDFAKLSPEDRIASRIRTGKEIVDKQIGFSASQRAVFEVFNRFEPLKRYAKLAGVSETWADPTIQAFNILNKNSIVFNWVKGNTTPVLLSNGDWKITNGSVADYLKLVRGSEKEFRSYLIARRVNYANNQLNEFKNELELLKSKPESLETSLQIKVIENQINKIQSVIENDDFSTQDALAVVQKYQVKFAEAEKIYDDINKKLIDFAEENGLINSEVADTYRAEKGYASFRRYIDDELSGDVGTIKTSSKSKVSSFKERTGSQLDIIDPVYSQILAINEIVGKSLENRLWQKVDNLTKKVPEISQRFERLEPITAVDPEGKVSFPQEKDPGIIRFFSNGKREFRKAGPEFLSVMKTLRGKEPDAFVQFLRIPSSTFTRLTTSANPLFAAGNLSVDQFSALTQTKTGFKPIIDPVKGLIDFISSDEGIKAYLAIGGKRQTLASYFDLSPDEIVSKLGGEQTKIQKVAGYVDSALGVLEWPSNLSEIITRFSEYKRAVDQGEPMSVAMYRASEVTTPFQLSGNFGGRLGQEYIRSIPYLNAIIQVLYKFGRTTRDNPTRVATMLAALLTAALTTAILTMDHSTEKQKRLLSEQPARNLGRYIYFPSPNGEDLIKTRIPEQFGAFTGMVYLYVIQNYGGNKAKFKDYIDSVTAAIPEQVNVLSPKKLILSYVPQVLKPSVLTASNTKVYPEVAPIVPPFVIDKAPKEQYNTYTSEVAKTLGQILGVSPMLVDFWVRNQFGAIGGVLLGKLPANPIGITEGEYVMSGRSYNAFYDNRELATQQYQEIVKNNPDKYSAKDKENASYSYKRFNKIADLLSDMRSLSKKVELPDDIRSSAYQLLKKAGTDDNLSNVVDDYINLENKINAYKLKMEVR